MHRPSRPSRRLFRSPSRSEHPDLAAAVDRFLGGDEHAFSTVYRALAPRVYGFLLRLTRERSLAEDLLQETFTRMVQARSDFRRGADIAPWACTIARHIFCDHVRRARVRQFEVEDASSYEHTLARPAPQPDEALSARRMARGVEAVLTALPRRQVEAFLLVREQGRSLDEAGAHLGRTELSVRLSVHRARSAIRAHLAETWGVSA